MLKRTFVISFAVPFLLFLCAGEISAAVSQDDEPGKQTIRFVQDDAQDYMVSKIFVLKYIQSNDITPFVQGIVKRYNMNSIVNCIEYGSQNQQILTVTCPVGIMPYVEDFLEKADRDIKIDGKIPGDIIRGTGITRATYRPKYRSGQVLINLIVNAFINAGPYGSVYGYDANSNQIYWKDNTTNTQFVYQFLGFLDRPAPQISFTANIFEVREDTLTDIGIDYLAWKNGPGLNLFQTAFQSFDLSSAGSDAIQSMTGPFGGFFFAPQFDASFLRILEQQGHADIKNTANVVVSNSDSKNYEIYFTPQLQNIVKSNNDQMAVGSSGVFAYNQVYLKILAPIANLHTGQEVEFSIQNYVPGQYAKTPGTVFFGYSAQSVNAVERNSYGAELIDMGQFSGNVTMALNKEVVLASWTKDVDVTQTIGVPWLCRIPYLKYLFSTTTVSRAKTKVYLTLKAELLNTGIQSETAGKLQRLK